VRYLTVLSGAVRWRRADVSIATPFGAFRFQGGAGGHSCSLSKMAEDGDPDSHPVSRAIGLANRAGPRPVHLPKNVHRAGVEPAMSRRTSRLQRAGFAGSH